MSERDWLLNVTCNNISVIYVMAHRCAGELKKKFDLQSGSQHHRDDRHFLGFFNVLPVQASARGQPFYGYSEKPTHINRLLKFMTRMGIRSYRLYPKRLRYLDGLVSQKTEYLPNENIPNDSESEYFPNTSKSFRVLPSHFQIKIVADLEGKIEVPRDVRNSKGP